MYEIWSLHMKYLFQAGIGPVQSFIASARRTHDLSFGSGLLSELAKAAALQIIELNGLESLIFPAPRQREMLNPSFNKLNIANKIVALIQQEPQELGESVHKAISKQLDAIRDKVYKDIAFHDKDEIYRRVAYAQIEDLVELLWVALPFEENEYPATRQQLEALMAARKNTRDFAFAKWGNSQPKSSVDGQFESVIPEHEYPSRRDSNEERLRKIHKLHEKYGAGPSEKLSGIDLLKRRGAKSFGGFPSTSHIATLSFLKRLELISDKEQAKRLWDIYIEKVKKIADPKDDDAVISSYKQAVDIEYIPQGYDLHPILQRHEGSMLFEARLVDLIDVAANDQRMKEAKDALREFYQFTNSQFLTLGLTKSQPNPYYALLLADGDGMGAVIDEQGKHGYEQHRKLSQTLDLFASQVDTVVKTHQGALVYTGGDDVLAFLPLHTVLDCASELAKSFKQTLADFADDKDRKPTLSVGIAIIHHLEPLREALNLAREAEKRAKNVDGKDALAIIVSKRSGEDYGIAGKWGQLDANLLQLIPLCQADKIPDGTAYELRDLARRLNVSTDQSNLNNTQKTLQEVLKRDAARILHRKLYVPHGKFPDEQAKEIESLLKAQLGIENESSSPKETKPVSIEEFTNELIIAQVLADARQLAGLKKEQKHDNLDH